MDARLPFQAFSLSTQLLFSRTQATPETLLVDEGLTTGRRLLAIAEPVDPTPRARAVAARALAALRAGCAEATDQPLAEAVLQAFTVANQTVWEENARARACSERRVQIGAAVLIFDGSDVLIGIAAPAQVILLQDGVFHCIPTLRSWGPAAVPEQLWPASEPLGFAPMPWVTRYATTVAPEDVIVLSTSAVGRALERHLAKRGLVKDASSLPTFLAAACRQSGVTGAVAALLTVEAASDRRPARRRPHVGLPAMLEPDHLEAPVREGTAGSRWCSALVDRLHIAAISLVEALVPAKPLPPLPWETQSRAAYPPGAAYVRRYRATRSELAPAVRARLPRTPWSGH